jgi:glycosyltransferase involved in cell wall biosynthesis
MSETGMKRGSLTAAMAATRRLRARADSPGLAQRERDLEARLRETEPGWLPLVPGPPRPVRPRGRNVVMHLLKSSLPDRQSGYTIRSRETMRAQVAVGLEPFAVTPFGYPPARDGRATPDIELVEGISHHRLAPGAPLDAVATDQILVRTAALAAEVAQRERPAIIQAASGLRGFDTPLVGVALRDHLQRPLVYEVRGFLETVWTSDPDLAENAEWSRRRYAREAEVMAAVDAITTLSDAMRDELVARGVPEDKITVVPNGIDAHAFAPTAPDPELRRRYGLDGRWVFGYVSNLDHPREGHEVLIEAAARLTRAGRSVACLLVGDGKRRAQLQAMAEASGAASSIVFTGRVPFEAVREHYALLDAFVVPRLPDRASRFVTPLKPYEAMAMGIPLVVSDLPALTDIAAPDERGLAFRTGDAAALTATLERLMDQPDVGRTLGSAGRRWVVAERTWDADGRRYRDLYESVLERFDAPAGAPTVAEPAAS